MFFTNLGRFTVRRRRLVLSLTVLFVVLAGAFGSGAFGVLRTGGFEDPSAESTIAHDLLEERFGAGDPNLVLLVDADDGDVDSAATTAAALELSAQLTATEHVADVVSYWTAGTPPGLRSRDGTSALVIARILGDEEQVDERFAGIADAVRGDRGAVDVEVGGSAAVFANLGEQIGEDLALAEMIAIPITLVLLVLVFGGLLAAGLPLLIALVAVAGTFLSLFVIGSITDVSIYSINLTTALGLGLAIDYSLFIVSRYREELRRGATPHAAVVRTVETAGRTVAFSAFVVAASLVARRTSRRAGSGTGSPTV
jgi:RND superfamily putative drug exporter